MFRKILLLLAACGLCHTDLLKAEIQEVTISWTAQECLGSCAKGLYDQFRKIHGVSEISINQSAGQASLRWEPNASFSYQPVQVAMQLMGLAINNIKVRVRGTIRNDSPTSFRLVSIGDSTSFTLAATPPPVKNQYVEQYNAQNRTLPKEMIQQLFEAQINDQIATISGPLFAPWRSPPLYLVIEKIQFDSK